MGERRGDLVQPANRVGEVVGPVVDATQERAAWAVVGLHAQTVVPVDAVGGGEALLPPLEAADDVAVRELDEVLDLPRRQRPRLLEREGRARGLREELQRHHLHGPLVTLRQTPRLARTKGRPERAATEGLDDLEVPVLQPHAPTHVQPRRPALTRCTPPTHRTPCPATPAPQRPAPWEEDEDDEEDAPRFGSRRRRPPFALGGPVALVLRSRPGWTASSASCPRPRWPSASAYSSASRAATRPTRSESTRRPFRTRSRSSASPSATKWSTASCSSAASTTQAWCVGARPHARAPVRARSVGR